MAIIPHPPVHLSLIRVHDIWLLLAVGAGWELLCRTVLLLVRRKSSTLVQQQAHLRRLQAQVTEKRKLGPSAFVETPKLERQVLVLERELGKIYETRKQYVHTLSIPYRVGSFCFAGGAIEYRTHFSITETCK